MRRPVALLSLIRGPNWKCLPQGVRTGSTEGTEDLLRRRLVIVGTPLAMGMARLETA